MSCRFNSLVFHVLLSVAGSVAQTGVRYYSLEPAADGSYLSEGVLLGNGDLLYFDRSWDHVVRIDPQGAVVWSERIQFQGWPPGWLHVAHAAEQVNGDIALAILKRGPSGLYHPSLALLNGAGEVLSATIDTVGAFQAYETMQIVAADGGALHLFSRHLDGDGYFDSFSDDGAWEQGLELSDEDAVPLRATRSSNLVVGACLRDLRAFDPDGQIEWMLRPAITSMAGVDHNAFIEDVVAVPGGFAFAFIRSGGPGLTAPGIGLVDASGVFQQAVVFEVEGSDAFTTIFTTRIAYTGSGLMLVANNTDIDDPSGYLFASSLDLSATAGWKIMDDWQGYPNSVCAVAAAGVVLTATASGLQAGERIIARALDVAALGSCFPVAQFDAVPFPMAVQAPIPMGTSPRASSWVPVVAEAVPNSISGGLLCGDQAAPESSALFMASVYPVPAVDRLRIQWPASGPIQVVVMDAMGRSLRGPESIDPASGVALHGLSPGQYWLRAGIPGTSYRHTLPFLVE
ncbi:MAG TPA: hypothetical protein PLB89_02945 [Flavobacteriales bacterium]|nr:hypothetical protein [Flavobacteriales bacterium]